MPYIKSNPPDRIKKLPKGAQSIWISAYNSAYEQYNKNEQKANAVAWTAVKKKYKKNKEGKWIKMSEPRLIFDLPVEFKEMPNGKYKSTIPLARTGKWIHPVYGDFEITDTDLIEIENNFGVTRQTQPPVNYEHNEGVDASVGAAGWVQSLTRDNGKLLGEVYWTKEAWEKISEGAFKYVSPEIRFHYKSKEDGDDKGTVLTGAALTTKPWIEDLVINLSESVFEEVKMELKDLAEVLNLQDFNQQDIITALEDFLDNAFDIDLPEISDKNQILRTLLDRLHSSAYLSEKTINSAIKAILELKEWTTKYINDLPDSAFAYIESGGEKDEDGKTVPRALRHLPFKDKNGKVDKPHLRNALARLPQTKLSASAKAKAKKRLVAAAKKAGVGDYDKKGGEKQVDIQTLIEKLDLAKDASEEDIIKTIDELLLVDLSGIYRKLELPEDASIDDIESVIDALKELETDKEKGTEMSEQIATLKTTVENLTTRLSETEKQAHAAELKLKEKERDEIVEKAIRVGKLTPAMRDSWANEMALNDSVQFNKLIETMPIVVDLAERGTAQSGDGDPIVKLNDAIKQVQTEQKLTYSEALSIVARESPELYRNYQDAARR